MQLRIRKSSSLGPASVGNHTVTTFDQLDALAREVARDVKTWARQVPLRKQGSQFTLKLFAEWTEPAPVKKRK